MKILGTNAVVRSTDREAAVARYQALFGAPPLLGFPIPDRKLYGTTFPGISVLSGETSALASLSNLRAIVFVDSLPEIEAELRRSGWTTEGSLVGDTGVLARDPDGNLIEFVENSDGKE